MSLRTTRRRFVAGTLAAGVAASGRMSGSANDSDKIAVALLQEHWAAIEPLAEAFAEQNGFEIEATPLGVEDLYSQLSLALTQRASTFDVVLLADPWIPQFASFLAPLEIPSKVTDAIVPIALEVNRYPSDAMACGVPVFGEAQFFVLRPEWLERVEQVPPVTWDDTVETASTIAAELDPDDERAAFGMRTRSSHQLVESFLPILRGYGKALIDPETSVPQLETPQALAAMETFLTLAGLSAEESAAEGAQNNAERFENGLIGMMANFWSSDLLAARALGEIPASGPLDTRLQPAQSGIDHQAMSAIWLAAVPVGALNQDPARTFVSWLVSAELQSLLPGLSLPPVRTDVLEDDDLLRQFPDLTVIREMLNIATSRPRSPFYPQLEQLLATALAGALSGEFSGSDAMKQANIDVREFLVREGVLTA